ncbi:hypothetical protein BG011_005195 [Mortierella polycephala]|uniref:Cenp-O kinetochore centromere component n=1 Tax=Mortierella polycephala TaxID=41804 RepID=A0A9P6U1A0_9FUNG|nr:hypothetical protein BG011_005195 [Mortierella polycephala]
MNPGVSEASSALQDDIDILCQELSSMEAKRDALLKQIEEEEKGMAEDTASLVPPPISTSEKDQRRTQDILMAYRLTGVTIFNDDEFDQQDLSVYGADEIPARPKRVGIRFETFAQAKYHEPYYVMLAKTAPTQDSEETEGETRSSATRNRGVLHIVKHTVPHWIPLRDIEKRYLNRDMSTFTHKVSDYLQAFVSRRENVSQLLQHLSAASSTYPGASPDTMEQATIPHLKCQSQDAAIRDVVFFFYRYDTLLKLFNRWRAKQALVADKENLDMEIDETPQGQESNKEKENLDLENISGPHLSAHVHLIYDDLATTRPTHVDIKFSSGNNRVLIEALPAADPQREQHVHWEHVLRTEYSLVEAITRIAELYHDEPSS